MRKGLFLGCLYILLIVGNLPARSHDTKEQHIRWGVAVKDEEIRILPNIVCSQWMRERDRSRQKGRVTSSEGIMRGIIVSFISGMAFEAGYDFWQRLYSNDSKPNTMEDVFRILDKECKIKPEEILAILAASFFILRQEIAPRYLK